MSGLSKSRLMSFLQCPKRLWLERHRPELAEIDVATEAAFATGHAVGNIARRLYDRGHGVLIEYDTGLAAAIRRTSEVLADPHVTPIFEATFEREQLLVRTDILERQARSARVIEVKASTKVKEEHVSDCAIQAWVVEASRARPRQIALAHVNNEFEFGGDGDYDGLLLEQDLSADVTPVKDCVPQWLTEAKRVLKREEPIVAIGTRCRSPYACPFIAYCWPEVEYPLTDLPSVGRKLDTFIARGYEDLREVPGEMITGAQQTRVWRATLAGVVEVDSAVRAALGTRAWPRFYLDFESVGPAVPFWTGTRPYQQIPFQWSLHIETAGGDLQHAQFLDLSGAAPMRPAAVALLESIGSKGPVYMYTGFERQCLETLAGFCPDLADRLDAVIARLVDLHPIVKRHYYHPAMHGSWSIKAVLPTIAPDMDYARLGEVREGTAAQLVYFEAISPATTPERREEIRTSLLAYCAFDTLAMVRIARHLEGR